MRSRRKKNLMWLSPMSDSIERVIIYPFASRTPLNLKLFSPFYLSHLSLLLRYLISRPFLQLTRRSGTWKCWTSPSPWSFPGSRVLARPSRPNTFSGTCARPADTLVDRLKGGSSTVGCNLVTQAHLIIFIDILKWFLNLIFIVLFLNSPRILDILLSPWKIDRCKNGWFECFRISKFL
jgi:hypothetical protein